MSREVPTTRYFAVGFFTAAQLEQKHRAMLVRANSSEGPGIGRPHLMASVHVTIFHADTGTETVELFLNNVAMQVLDPGLEADGAHFVMERFGEKTFPPKGLTPKQGFAEYLMSPDGIATFGKATAVQLFSMDISARSD
jgi:hypothetical protein